MLKDLKSMPKALLMFMDPLLFLKNCDLKSSISVESFARRFFSIVGVASTEDFYKIDFR